MSFHNDRINPQRPKFGSSVQKEDLNGQAELTLTKDINADVTVLSFHCLAGFNVINDLYKHSASFFLG